MLSPFWWLILKSSEFMRSHFADDAFECASNSDISVVQILRHMFPSEYSSSA